MDVCEKCKLEKDSDEMCNDESGICHSCYDEWFAAEYAYWKPLYLGEVSAGIAGLSNDEREAVIKEAKS